MVNYRRNIRSQSWTLPRTTAFPGQLQKVLSLFWSMMACFDEKRTGLLGFRGYLLMMYETYLMSEYRSK